VLDINVFKLKHQCRPSK